MNRKKLIIGIAGGVAALSLIGVGAGASFADKATASQTITRGYINTLLSPDNNNDYAKSITFAAAGPLDGSDQTVTKTLYIANTGDVPEVIHGIGCNYDGAVVDAVAVNGVLLTCNGAAGTNDINKAVPAGGIVSVPVVYHIPASNANFGGSAPTATPNDTSSTVTLALHATG